MPIPEFNGYSFLGWTQTLNGSDYIGENDIVSFVIDTEVFAKWQANSYNVTFVSDNLETSSIQIIYKSNYGELPVLTKNGYDFSGWYADSSYLSPITQDSMMDQFVDHNIYAKWTAIRSQISFNVESVSGAVAPSPIYVDYDSVYGALPAINKTGYNFNGWFTNLDGGEEVRSDSKVLIQEAKVLYPQFSPKEFTLSFNLDEGVLTGQQTLQIFYDQNYSNLPIPEKNGYRFEGWFDALEDGYKVSSENKFELIDNQTLFAYWTPLPYQVTFIKDDVLIFSKEVIFNEVYGELPVSSRTGYTFVGWSDQIFGGQIIELDSKLSVPNNQTLYAQFLPLTFNVYYYINLGNDYQLISRIDTYDSTYSNIPEAIRTGFDFVGWFTAEQGGTQISSNSIVNILEDTTYYAQWKLKQFNLTFNSNGGSAVAPITADFESAVNVIAPTREGHVFNNWSPTLPTKMPALDTLYFANWNIESYNIDFFINDGSNALYQKLTAIYNSQIGSLLNPNPTREGFIFLGWAEDATTTDASGLFNLPQIMPDLGENGISVALYAVWKPIEFTINYFGLVEPIADNPVTYTFETADINLKTDLELPGYLFVGYFEDSGFTAGPITTIIQGSIGDKNLYAKLEKIPFNLVFKDNLGNIISEEVVLFSEPIFESSIPKIEIPGFEFVRWNPQIPDTMPAEDVEVVAEIKAIKYKLTIENSLGNIIVDEEVEFDQSLLPFSSVPREIEGYEFLSWSTDIPETMPAKDLTIIAKYKKIPIFNLIVLGTQDQILIKFELREDQLVPNTTLPDLSDSLDFIFEGWDGEIPNFMPGQDLTIRPIGTKRMNSINLYSKDQTLLSRIEAQVGSSLDIADPQRIGYTFVGWSTSSEELIDINLMPSESYDLFATWTPKIYTVVVSVASLDYQIDIEFDKPIGQIVTPQLFGYRFDGWKNNLTDEFINSNTIFNSPEQINLVPVFTRLNAVETLVATPGFIINLIARIFR